MLQKEQLEQLYKSGLSMKEISIKLQCSENKVDYWIDKYNISKRSRSEASYYGYWRPRSNRKEEKLKVAGIMLYWAEGGKEVRRNNGQWRGNSINFANSDPKMIKVFLRFLRKICGVDERRFSAYCLF